MSMTIGPVFSDDSSIYSLGACSSNSSVDDPAPALPVFISSKRKWNIAQNASTLKSLSSSSPEVMDYLADCCEHKLVPPKYSKITKKHSMDQRVSKGVKGDVLGGKFMGTLYFPSHKVIVCSYSSNNHLYVDIHGLVKSPFDGTPHVPHIVLTEDDDVALSNYHKAPNEKVPYTGNNRFVTYNQDGVEMPEVSVVTCDRCVQYAEITQKKRVALS